MSKIWLIVLAGYDLISVIFKEFVRFSGSVNAKCVKSANTKMIVEDRIVRI